jgi:pyruvoyl-dependent arginine decarboxylase
MLPSKLYLGQGVGIHKHNKNARDRASEQCGLADLNILNVSSVLPAGIVVIETIEEFRSLVIPGQIVHAIHGICESNVVGQRVTSTLTAVLPEDPSVVGYVAETYEWPGLTTEMAIRRTETSALQLFAERHGDRDFVADDVWKAGRDRYTIAGINVRLRTLNAVGDVDWQGNFCCALAAAVLLP